MLVCISAPPSSSSVAISPVAAFKSGGPVPFELGHDVACDPQRVAVVLGEIIAEPGNGRVHLGAAEFFFRRDLSGRGLEQRRTGEKRGCGRAP